MSVSSIVIIKAITCLVCRQRGRWWK